MTYVDDYYTYPSRTIAQPTTRPVKPLRADINGYFLVHSEDYREP